MTFKKLYFVYIWLPFLRQKKVKAFIPSKVERIKPEKFYAGFCFDETTKIIVEHSRNNVTNHSP